MFWLVWRVSKRNSNSKIVSLSDCLAKPKEKYETFKTIFLLDHHHNSQLDTNGPDLTISPSPSYVFPFPSASISSPPIPFSPGRPETFEAKLPLKVKPLSEQRKSLAFNSWYQSKLRKKTFESLDKI